jgi:multisubunit Na+/H+ antiporter MnhB subunit
MMKILVSIAFLLILLSMGSALVSLMRDKGKNNNMVKALAFRVAFSIGLFVLILLANYFGYIQPTGIH